MDTTNLQVGLIRLPRSIKRMIAVLADASVILAALALTIALVHHEGLASIGHYWPLFVAALLVAIPVFTQQGLYRAIIRFIGSQCISHAYNLLSG